jgi:CheY-like chemotaxis protein
VFQEGRQQILAAGCDEFLHKPFSRDTLLQTVIKYFQQDHQDDHQQNLQSIPVDIPSATSASASVTQSLKPAAPTTSSTSTFLRSPNSLVDSVMALPVAWRTTLLELLSVGDITAALDHTQTLADTPEHAAILTKLTDMLSAFQLDELLELLETANAS